MAGEADDEAGSIEVDMSADAGAKDAVVRHGSVKTAPRDSDPDEVWAERSKKVQKRITGMKRQFDQQRAQDQAEFQRQLAERDERLAALEGRKSGVATDDAEHERRMDAMQAQIAEAQENGDSQLVAKLTREMSKADAQYWSAKTAKQLGGGAAAAAAGAPAAGGRPQPKVRVPTQAGLAFAKANSDWWDDPDEESQEAKAYANALHTRMLAEGEEDPEKPEYFEIIRRKVAKRFPEISTVSTLKGRRNADPDDDDDDEDAPAARRQDTRLNTNRRAPAQNFGTRGNENQGNRQRNVKTLTGAEQRAMQKVGMDPNNNAHVMAYVRSMNEMEAG